MDPVPPKLVCREREDHAAPWRWLSAERARTADGGGVRAGPGHGRVIVNHKQIAGPCVNTSSGGSLGAPADRPGHDLDGRPSRILWDFKCHRQGREPPWGYLLIAVVHLAFAREKCGWRRNNLHPLLGLCAGLEHKLERIFVPESGVSMRWQLKVSIRTSFQR